jgi:hypothetical protein
MSKSIKGFYKPHVIDLFRDLLNIYHQKDHGIVADDDLPKGKYQYRKSSVEITVDGSSIYLSGETRVRDGETTIEEKPVRFRISMSEGAS